MATKKIQIEFDLNTNEVKLAGEATLSLAQQVRILTKELSKTPEGTKEFELLRRKLGDTKDNLDRVNAKSRELFGTLSLIPGPIGEVAGKLNGAISLMKTFSGFSFKDIKNQFNGLLDDIKNIFVALGTWGEQTKDLEGTVGDLNDTTATFSEKLGQTASNAGAAGDSVVSYNEKLQQEIDLMKEAALESANSISKNNEEIATITEKANSIEDLSSLTDEQVNSLVDLIDTNEALTENLSEQITVVEELQVQQEGAVVTTQAQTGANVALTRSTVATSTALRVLKGVLASLGIGLLIIGITTLISKIGDWLTSTDEAEKAQKELNDELAKQQQLLEGDQAAFERSSNERLAYLKSIGASEQQLSKERISLKRQEVIQLQAAEDEARALYNSSLGKANRETLDRLNDNLNKRIEATRNGLSSLRVLQLDAITQNNKDQDQKRDKDQQARNKDLEELKEFQRQADLTLMEAKDREIAEVQDKYKKQIDLAKKYRQDITDLVAAQAKEILEINKKYDEELRTKKIADYQALITIEENQQDVDTERLIQLLGKRRDLELKEANLTREQKLAIQAQYEADFRKLRQDAREKQLVEDIQASEGNFEKQIELYRQYADEIIKSTTYTEAEKLRIIQETNDRILSLEQQRFDNEKTKLELKREQDRLTNTEYYDELDALYVKELERAKQQKDQLIITEAEYNKRVKELSDARNNIRQAELDAEIATFQAIGQGLVAVSQLIGENTKQGKAFAVAATLVNTYAAIAAQLRTAAGSLGGAIPGYAIAQAIATGLVGFAQVKKILSTQVPASTPSNTSNIGTGAINVNQRRAQGGIVFGSGGDFSDNIPAMLSNGEFVVNARSTRVFRPLLESMNSAANLPQFAVGGLVSGPGMTPPQSQNETIADAISSAFGQTPIRTYVTATDVSTQQQFDRIIKSRSLI